MLRNRMFWWVWVVVGMLMVAGTAWLVLANGEAQSISADWSPHCAVYAGPDQWVPEPSPVTVQFDGWGSPSDFGESVSYQWFNQWGELRAEEEDPTLSVNFGNENPQPGTTRIFTLRVIDDEGTTCELEDSVTITIRDPADFQLIADAGPDQIVSGSNPVNVRFDGSGSSSPNGKIVDYQWYNQWGEMAFQGSVPVFDGSVDFGEDPQPGTTRTFTLIVADEEGFVSEEDSVTITLGEGDPRDGQGFIGISQSYELWGWGSGESYTFVAGKLDDGRWYVSSRADGPEIWGYPVSVECHQGEHWEVLIADGPEPKEREGCVGDAALGELVILTNQAGGWTISNQDISDGVVATLDRGAAQYYKFLGEQKIAE